MTEVHVSSAVMTHPVRLTQAQDLAARLRLDGLALDPDPEGPPSALRTALVAWAAVDPGASHHLVVQDDVDAPTELMEIVGRAAARFPDEALVFYTNWHARNGAAVRIAALAGACWVRAVPDEFTPSLGVCLPSGTAAGFREYARDSAERHDDELLSVFFRGRGRMSLLSVPNIVEHIGTSSINGHAAQGIRLAVCPTSAADAAPLLARGRVLEEPGWIPYMRYGEGYIRLDGQERGADGGRGHHRWRDALPATGLTEELVREARAAHMPDGLAADVARSFGRDFAEELWIHCLLLGRQAARAARRLGPSPDGVPPDALDRMRHSAVATAGPAGLPPERRPEAGSDEVRTMAAFTWTAVRAGERLQGVSPGITPSPGGLSDG
ncbi:hypothetical protein [Streptomyces sp. NBC_00893]|uniref:hypothetical protein n=1 Tax=Streptomyces sp. NBC_00893 TaxID=2975862 RepID=UPI002257F605|nr:hypothetical protein [Streptomyces sp. NBC_00893]MCX4851208.1 hypothetical protein [Streptomyces sp. NBC_00893]